MEKIKTDIRNWIPAIEVIVVLVTILGSTIPLYLHTDSKMNERERRTEEILDAIRQDIKDFHGRLERQDAEFKAHILHNHKQ